MWRSQGGPTETHGPGWTGHGSRALSIVARSEEARFLDSRHKDSIGWGPGARFSEIHGRWAPVEMIQVKEMAKRGSVLKIYGHKCRINWGSVLRNAGPGPQLKGLRNVYPVYEMDRWEEGTEA